MRAVEDPMKVLPNIKKAIEADREKHEKAKEIFVAADDAALVAKLSRAHSPFIYSLGTNGIVPQGGTLAFHVHFYNPDPTTRANLFVWGFLGPAQLVVDPVTALLTTDLRFPRLHQPADRWGTTLETNASGVASFYIKIPTIEPGCYVIHGFLYQFVYFGTSTLLDREGLPITVT